MIEINLLHIKKKFKMPVVLGIDFSQLTYGFIIIAAIFNFIPSLLIYDIWRGKENIINKEVSTLNKTLAKLKKEMKPHRNLKKKLDAFNSQVVKLKRRSGQVDRIIKNKTNPKFLLETIARNIPEDMWFNILTIDSKNKITIEGSSISYKSIGDFRNGGNDTGFFGRTLDLADTKTVEEKHRGQKVRVQSYIIKGVIKSYSPWEQK